MDGNPPGREELRHEFFESCFVLRRKFERKVVDLVIDAGLSLRDETLRLASTRGGVRKSLKLLVKQLQLRRQALRRGADRRVVGVGESEAVLQVIAEGVPVVALFLKLCREGVQVGLMDEEVPVEVLKRYRLKLL